MYLICQLPLILKKSRFCKCIPREDVGVCSKTQGTFWPSQHYTISLGYCINLTNHSSGLFLCFECIFRIYNIFLREQNRVSDKLLHTWCNSNPLLSKVHLLWGGVHKPCGHGRGRGLCQMYIVQPYLVKWSTKGERGG